MNRFLIAFIGVVALVGLPGPAVICAQSSGKQSVAEPTSAGTADPHSSTSQPQFFDEPHFTVAGVTDTTTVGGHGSSQTMLRNTESMVKAAASLTDKSSPEPPPSELGSEESLRHAVQQQPESFEANSRLGRWLVEEERPAEGIVYLERASTTNPNDFENLYALGLAYFKMANYSYAKTELGSSLGTSGSAEQKARAHRLRGEVDEKLGNSLDALREFQQAAEIDCSEANLFSWGSELLLHRAAEPATEVFTKGVRLFPRSVRMLSALGASWYALGYSEKASEALCAASDIDPNDPDPYLFMGKMLAGEEVPSSAILERLERFARLHPENAAANYYYAVSLWKLRNDNAEVLTHVRLLLTRSVRLDPKFGEAYLQLGMVDAEQKDVAEAISAYEKAIAAAPDLEEAHYRLAQVYKQSGEPAKAESELKAYENISKQKTEELESERRRTQQFVYQLQHDR